MKPRHAASLVAVLVCAFGCQSAPTPPEGNPGGSGGSGAGTGGSGGNAAGGSAGSATPGAGGTGGNASATDAAVPPGDVAPVPPAGARPLTANDVSVLFPRFGNEAPKQLWRPTLAGKGGPFVSLSQFENITKQTLSKNLIGPATGPSILTPAQEFDLLRVVAVRFDPCFAGTPCQAQIRLVLQGFNAQGAALDGAVHLLYNLTANDFREVVAELRTMTALAPENRADLPLSPSPALTAQGMEGPYGKALRALVTRHAGAGNLARMTFMNRGLGAQAQWEFGGFDIDAGSARLMALPGLPAATTRQVVGIVFAEWGYFLSPLSVRLPAVAPVINSTEAKKASAMTIDEGFAALASVSNPLRENPEGADCATCHVANHLRGQVERHHKVTAPTTVYPSEAQARRMTGPAETERDNLRAFGYFDGREPSVAISQRVANETHQVLQLLEKF